jgi:hypothetical protein
MLEAVPGSNSCDEEGIPAQLLGAKMGSVRDE